MISRRTHGILDYVVGLILILSPKLFGFDGTGVAARLPVILGLAALIYSLCTKYELGAFKVLPFRAHLTLDVLSGILLAASPWLFGFAGQVRWPHVVLGLVEVGAVLMTRATVETHDGMHGTPIAH
jgi:hypothetical protein